MQFPVGATTYHWGELWFTALWSYLFGLKAVYTLCLITYPLLSTLLILGAIALLKEQITKVPTYLILIISFGFLFYRPILAYLVGWGDPICSHPKSFFPTIILIWATIYLFKKDFLIFSIILALILPINTVLAAGAYSFGFLLCTAAFLRKHTNRKVFLRSLLLFILLTVCYLIFNIVQPKSLVQQPLSQLYEGDMYINILSFSIKRIMRPILFLISISVVYLLIKSYKHNFVLSNFKDYFQVLIIYVVSCIVSVIVGGTAKQFLLDGGQITTMYCNLTSSIFVLCTTAIIIKTLKCNKAISIACILSSATFIFLYVQFDGHSTYYKESISSNDYESFVSVSEKINNSTTPSFGYIRNYNLPQNHNTMDTRSNFAHPMQYLVHFIASGFYYPLCLSVLDLPDDIEPRFNDSENTKLFQYFKRNHNNCSVLDDNAKGLLINRFIKDENIHFIIVETGAELPLYLNGVTKLIASNSDGKIYEVFN